MSGVVRVPDDVLREAKRIGELQGAQPGELLAAAWREYFARHREQFARDLEESARLLRDGSLEELASFASRNSKDRARRMREQALAQGQQKP